MSAPTEPSWDGSPSWLVQQARVILRLSADDPDIERLARLARVVTELVRFHIAQDAPVLAEAIPEPVTDACVNSLVEQYRRKDAPFGITGAVGGDGVALRISADWLDPVRMSINPYKTSWGLA